MKFFKTILKNIFSKYPPSKPMRYIVEKSREGGFIAHFEHSPDTYGQGKTMEEAMKDLDLVYLSVLEMEYEESKIKLNKTKKELEEKYLKNKSQPKKITFIEDNDLQLV